MRRCVLGTFFFLAACGGGVHSTSPAVADQHSSDAASARAERARIAFTAGGQEALRTYSQLYGDDAVGTCFSAWIDEAATSGLQEPMARPDAHALRRFLCTCVGASDCR